MIPGTLKIFNFGMRAFELSFSPAEDKEDSKIYRVVGMDRLLSLSKKLSIAFTPEELEALKRGTHIAKECELDQADYRTFFT
jgi:hypothetical protein